jgi:hypothetical protein
LQYNRNNGFAYEIEFNEYFRSVELLDAVPETIKAYFPKFMPNINEGNWSKKYVIDRSFLVNDSSCSVKLPTTVTEQGYMTISRYPNEAPDFTYKIVELSDGTHKIPIGTQFMAEFLHGDIMTGHFTGKV